MTTTAINTTRFATPVHITREELKRLTPYEGWLSEDNMFKYIDLDSVLGKDGFWERLCLRYEDGWWVLTRESGGGDDVHDLTTLRVFYCPVEPGVMPRLECIPVVLHPLPPERRERMEGPAFLVEIRPQSGTFLGQYAFPDGIRSAIERTFYRNVRAVGGWAGDVTVEA